MPRLELNFDSGESSLEVRHFAVHEAVSSLFSVTVVARSTNPAIKLETIVGKPASFRAVSAYKWSMLGGARYWTGICSYMEQVQAELTGLSTYRVRIVPSLWFLTQRRNYRIFQHQAIPEIVNDILVEWNMEVAWKIDGLAYPKLPFKVQYGETDFAFVSRLLEEAGIAFTFPDDDDKGSIVSFCDKLHKGDPRSKDGVLYVDNPSQSGEREFVTNVHLAHDVRPAAHVIRDYDFRNPEFKLFSKEPKVAAPEALHEQYHYQPGAFLIDTQRPIATPAADDKAVSRHEQKFGTGQASRALEGTRLDRRTVPFDTNTIDLWPGMIFSISRHPHPEIEDQRLLMLEFNVEGMPESEWSMSGLAVFADVPHRPAARTPKPEIVGVQSAQVVGPDTQEIHVDEFGRVRVRFPWLRGGPSDDNCSCWIRVNDGWGGAGYGMLPLPRVGQEVLVAFLNGDPDQPVIVGRVYNERNPVPYTLPEHKTKSTWKSQSSIGSSGFNEIMFEDKKGDELFRLQAEKNLRQLVKNDETSTIQNDRSKFVRALETDTTGVDRTEVTGADRTEFTDLHKTTIIGENRTKLVKGDEIEITDGNRLLLVKKDTDIVIKGSKKERLLSDRHLRVKGHRSQHIEKTQSLIVVEDQHEKVGKNYALETGRELHLRAQKLFVAEGGQGVTLKGPGGFIQIDATGIVIKGTVVKINVSGSPGEGKGSSPVEPLEPLEAEIEEPEKPSGGEAVLKEKKSLPQKAFAKSGDEVILYKPIRAKKFIHFAETADITTPKDGLILWSGGADVAGMAAGELAERRSNRTKNPIPSKRLEMTPGGQGLQDMAKDDSWETHQEAWGVISRRLAKQASGEVTVVARLPIRRDAILHQELKALSQNKKVTKITCFAVKMDGTGRDAKPMRNAKGEVILEPVSVKQVLKKPRRVNKAHR